MITFNELKKIKNAGAYIGTESKIKNFNNTLDKLKILIASPLKYEDAVADEDFKKIYSIVNNINYAFCERVTAPLKDFEELLLNKNEPLFSIENKIPIDKFDICIFCIPNDLTYTNVLNIMTLGNIDPIKKNQDKTPQAKQYPIIIGTGRCLLGYENSLSEIFDILVLGEPEVTIKNVLDVIQETISLKENKIKNTLSNNINDILQSKLSNFPYVYMKDYKKDVKYGYLKEYSLDTPKHLITPSIPSRENISSVRVSKGCNRKCINCQDRYIYDKMYQKATDYVVLDSVKYIETTGMKDLRLKSNCYFDFEDKTDLIYYLKNENIIRDIVIQHIFFDMSNLMLLDLLDKNEIPKIKVDSANETLRNNYGNYITEQEIYSVARNIFEKGFTKLKLCFTIGLPKETYEDLSHIYLVANKIIDIYFNIHKKLPDKYIVVLNINYYEIAKNTPSFNTKINTLDSLEVKERYIKDKKDNGYIKLEFEDKYRSTLKNIIRKLDKKLIKIITDAYEFGARFDYTKDINYEPWEIAFGINNVDIKSCFEGNIEKKED